MGLRRKLPELRNAQARGAFYGAGRGYARLHGGHGRFHRSVHAEAAGSPRHHIESKVCAPGAYPIRGRGGTRTRSSATRPKYTPVLLGAVSRSAGRLLRWTVVRAIHGPFGLGKRIRGLPAFLPRRGVSEHQKDLHCRAPVLPLLGPVCSLPQEMAPRTGWAAVEEDYLAHRHQYCIATIPSSRCRSSTPMGPPE